jgi:hypothetical protein
MEYGNLKNNTIKKYKINNTNKTNNTNKINKTNKTIGGYRTKGAKDKLKRCTRGHRRCNITGECKPAYYFVKDEGADNTLFSNKLIAELTKTADVKRVLNNKGIMFQTLSQFTAGKTFSKYSGKDNEDELYRKIGSACGDVVSSDYIEKSLNEVLDDQPNPYMDILFIKNKRQKILGFLIAELGACAMRRQTYAINLICSESGLGKLLVGACLYCIKYNEDVSTKSCILELAHAYRNIPGFFMYTKMGFNVDNSLIGDKYDYCFHDASQLPMSVKLTDKYTKQYIVSAMVRSDFKQTDARDHTGIYELGLPLTKESESEISEAMQEKMVLIANIIRKFKVYSKNEKYRNTGVTLLPTDEWKYVKRMNFIKSKSNKIPVESQQAFRKYLHANHYAENDLFDELEKEFNQAKQEFAEIKK